MAAWTVTHRQIARDKDARENVVEKDLAEHVLSLLV
jgi:hypothetical protein